MALSANPFTNRPDAPEAGAVNITLTPDRGLPEESCTMAFRSVVNGVPTTVLCGVPVAARILPGEPDVFVRSKAAPLGIPVAVATTWYVPTKLLAKNVGAVAMPDAAVAAVVILFPPENVPLGPFAGAVNVTVTPPTAFPEESVTSAPRGSRNG
jgi:hypothetical protein